jgi:hypothetical protein
MNDTSGTTERSQESAPPLVTLDLGVRYPAKSFYSVDELRRFAQQEYSFWQFVANSPSTGYASQGSSSQLTWSTQLWSYVSTIDQILATNPNENISGHLQNIMNTAANSVAGGRALLSDDPRALVVRDLWASDSATAANMLAYWNQQFRMFDETQFNATFRAVAFDQGLKENLDVERAALAQLRTDFAVHAESVKVSLGTASADVRAARQNQATQQASFAEETAAQIASSKETFEALLSSATAKLEAIEKTYDEKLALQSAVKYWDERAEQSRVSARTFSWAAAAFILIYVGLLLVFGGQITGHIVGGMPESAQAGWTIGVFAALALLGIWVARILVRLILSHTHLTTDAKHRRTLVLTYLALLREGDRAATEKERPLVLEQLFRPASDGIVRDDAMPPTPAEWLTRGLSGTGRS